MGTHCSKGNGGVEYAPKRQKSWNNSCKKGLIATFHSYRTTEWYLECMKTLTDWPYNQESAYVKAERWEHFLQFSTESPCLQYLPDQEEEDEITNLFRKLATDLQDPKHPISAVISVFMALFSQEIDKGIAVSRFKTNPVAAEKLLWEISTVIFKLLSVLDSATVELYSIISLILQRKLLDLNGLLLENIMKKDLNRQIHSLAEIIWQEKQEKYRLLTLREDLRLTLRSEIPGFVSELTLTEVTNQLNSLIICENLHFRRIPLRIISEKLLQVPSECRKTLLALCILRTESVNLVCEFQLTHLFVNEAPEALEAVLTALDWLLSDS